MPATHVIGSFGIAACLACGGRSDLDVPVGPAASPAVDAATFDVVAPSIDSGVEPDATPPLCMVSSPTLLTTTSGTPDEIVVSGGYVYWSDGSGISRIPASGGTVLPIASTVWGWPMYDHFLVDGPNLVWASNGLEMTPLSGGPSQKIGSLSAAGVTADDNGLLVWQFDGIESPLEQVERQGASVTAVTTALPDATIQMIAVGDTFYGGSETEGVFTITNGAVAKLGTAPVNDLAWDGTTLFFTEWGMSSVSVWRVDDGNATSITPVPYAWLGGLAVTSDYVYFANRSTGGVERIDKDGTNHVTVGSVPVVGAWSEALGVAVDASCVYWTVAQDGPDSAGVWVAPL